MTLSKFVVIILLLLSFRVQAATLHLGEDDETGATGNTTTVANTKYGGNIGSPTSDGTVDSIVFLMSEFGTDNDCVFFLVKVENGTGGTNTVLDSTVEFNVSIEGTETWIQVAVAENASIVTTETYAIIPWCEANGTIDVYRITSGTQDLWYTSGATYDGLIGSSYTPASIFGSRKIWAYLVYTEGGEPEEDQSTRRRKIILRGDTNEKDIYSVNYFSVPCTNK